MAWLVCGERVLASLELANTASQRRRGLLGRDDVAGAMLLKPAGRVHSLGLRFAIDVAQLDAALTVLRITTMERNRIGRHVRGARAVLEAEAGSFGRWGITVGDELAVRD